MLKEFEMYEKAIEIAIKAHEKQKDKGGKSYIYHPLYVATQCEDLRYKIVAVLHDVVEDSDISVLDLINMGFSGDVVEAVSLLTKSDCDKKGQGYVDYLKRIRKNDIALVVKLEDLKHNSDLSRLEVVKERDLARVEKYKKSIAFLQHKIGEEELL